MANHGPIVAGKYLITTMYNMEALAESAKLMMLLDGKNTNPLSELDWQELLSRFG